VAFIILLGGGGWYIRWSESKLTENVFTCPIFWVTDFGATLTFGVPCISKARETMRT
jgi:hypothetical protein